MVHVRTDHDDGERSQKPGCRRVLGVREAQIGRGHEKQHAVSIFCARRLLIVVDGLGLFCGSGSAGGSHVMKNKLAVKFRYDVRGDRIVRSDGLGLQGARHNNRQRATFFVWQSASSPKVILTTLTSREVI